MCTAVQRKGQVIFSPFRVFHLSAAELALRFAGLSPRLFFTFPRGSAVAAPSLLASDQADYSVAPIAVHAGLISNGAILSAGGQEACGIRLALRIVRSFVAGRCWPVRGGQASSRLCPGEYSSQ